MSPHGFLVWIHASDMMLAQKKKRKKKPGWEMSGILGIGK
jgi:hypothetical protein